MFLMRFCIPLLAFAWVFSGCGGGDKQPAPSAGESAAPETKSTWPTGPVTIVCADSNGGDTSTFLQALAPAMGKELGVEVSVESVGSAAIVQVGESSDGNTWLGMSDEMLVASRQGQTNVNLADWDFTVVARSPAVISVPSNTRTGKLPNIIRESKREESEISFAASNPGGIWHAKLDVLARATKTTLQLKKFPGVGPSRLAASSGQVTAVVTSIEDQLGDIKAGKLKPLAIIDARPITVPGFGEIPSAADFYPSVEDDPVNRFVGVALPANVSADIKARIGAAIGKALNDQTIKALASKRFWQLDGTTGDQANKQITEAARHREALFASLEKKEEEEL